jgi:DNA polymerase-3 subunit alpha
LRDLCERLYDCGLNKRNLESFIKCGSLDSLKLKRSVLMSCWENIFESIKNDNKNLISGQVSLFGDTEEGNIPIEYDYPDIDEYSLDQILVMEKEVTGLYLSGHPLDKYKDKIDKYVNMFSYNTQEKNDDDEYSQTNEFVGKTVNIAGIINEKKLITTKANKLMAVLTIEDFYGNIEVIVYSEAYEHYRFELEKGNIVIINGNVTHREDEPLKVVLKKVKSLSDMVVKNKGIILDTEEYTEEFLKGIYGILNFFSGTKSKLHIYNKNMENIELFEKKEFDVILTSDLIIDLKERLGEKNVLI